jgi:hypothetical protein
METAPGGKPRTRGWMETARFAHPRIARFGGKPRSAPWLEPRVSALCLEARIRASAHRLKPRVGEKPRIGRHRVPRIRALLETAHPRASTCTPPFSPP